MMSSSKHRVKQILHLKLKKRLNVGRTLFVLLYQLAKKFEILCFFKIMGDFLCCLERIFKPLLTYCQLGTPDKSINDNVIVLGIIRVTRIAVMQ